MVRQRLAYPIVILALVGAVWYNGHEGVARAAEQGQIAHDGLCALRDDIQKRHDASVQYLLENPRGVVSPKTNTVIISRTEIQRSISDRKATLKALDNSGLEC